ncbi:MAG: hypothetical protein P8N92_02630, partial [Burkholderiales bacterium]|nr:hypothetical protein [Burkholderiales bacterium]
VLSVLLVLLITTNLEIDRPIRLFFSNAVGALLDYRLDLEKLHLSLLGVVDFETVLSGRFSNLSANLAVLTVLGGLFCYVKLLNKQIKPVMVFIVPILFAITYYWLQGGQYHVIRMTEFLGVVLVAMAIAGLTSAYNSSQKIRMFVILVLGGLFLINAVIVKVKINKRVLSTIPDIRASVIDAHDIKLAESLEYEFSNLAPQPVVYWMGWGSVPFANHEILFRNLKYVEAFEYDYSYVGMDILAPQHLDDALLIYPNDGAADILHIKDDILENAKSKLGRRVVQRVGSGSGAAIVGTGWMSPTIEGGKTVRYLRSAQEGGLVIWSEAPKTVQIEIEASGVEAGMFLTLRKPEQEYEVPLTDKFIFRQEDESSEQYFLRIRKSMAQNPSVSAAFYNLQDDFNGHFDSSSTIFNERLSLSDHFKLFIILNIEVKSELTVNLVEKYQQQQLTYKLNAFHDKDPTLIRFKLALNKGVNIMRFIGRDSDGRRSGRDAKKGIFYNPTINVPYIVVRKIHISQPDADLITF